MASCNRRESLLGSHSHWSLRRNLVAAGVTPPTSPSAWWRSGSASGSGRRHRGWSCAAPCTARPCWRCPWPPSRTAARRRDARPAGRRRCAPPRSPGVPPGCTSRCRPCCSRRRRCPWTAASPPSPWCAGGGAGRALHRWWPLRERWW